MLLPHSIEADDIEQWGTSFTVEKLRASLKWEVRVLYMVPVIATVNFFSLMAALALVGCAALFVLITDGAFSFIVTIIFLRPIFQTLQLASAVGRGESQLARKLQHSKYRNVSGCFIAVVSSSLLYVNFGLWAAMGDRFAISPYLNPFVFGVNLDSILNDLMALVLCGFFRDISDGVSEKRKTMFPEEDPSTKQKVKRLKA
jgi:hypothetical protein